MKLNNIFVHQIDRASKSVTPIPLNEELADLQAYVGLLVDRILGAPGRRRFQFERPTCEVPLLLARAYGDGEWAEAAEGVASRLLKVEISVSGQYGHLPEIPRGSLIQCAIELEGKPAYLLAKVEHDQYLDQTELVRKLGLPYAKHALKTCLIDVNDDNEIGKTWVSDSSSRIARYWWENFLELVEEYTDQQNTLRAFNSVESLLTKKVKKVSPADFTFLRNNLVGYFRTQEEFAITGLLDHVFGTYEPDNEKVDVDELRAATAALVSDGKFDGQFTVVPRVIRARIKRVIPLTDEIDLNLKAEIPNLRDVIKAKESPDGTKYLEIKTERGWNAFKTSDEEP
jgi:hypothetical protein